MEKRHALNMIDSIINTQVDALAADTGIDPEVARLAREALRNARMDVRLLLEQALTECRDEVDVDDAIDEAETLTRDAA